jgi:hypothetical protein
MKVEVTEVRKADDGWIGAGRVLDQQTSKPSNLWVVFTLNETDAGLMRNAILQGSARQHAVVESEILEARLDR